jgi:hypothetical protein
MTGPNNGGGNIPEAHEMVNLSPDAKKDVATTALQTLGADEVDAKKDIATTALQTLGGDAVDAKKDIATTALQTLGANAVDAKKDIATTALQTLGADAVDAKKDIATNALQTLSHEAREDVIGQVQGPSRFVSDRIWQWVVGAFAIVFVGGSAALVASVFLLPVEQIQVLLTLFTTVAGILAGFISGRASASGGSRGSS